MPFLIDAKVRTFSIHANVSAAFFSKMLYKLTLFYLDAFLCKT